MKEPDCQLLDPTDTKRKHLSHMNVTLEDEILESPVKLVPQSEMKDISERSMEFTQEKIGKYENLIGYIISLFRRTFKIRKVKVNIYSPGLGFTKHFLSSHLSTAFVLS